MLGLPEAGSNEEGFYPRTFRGSMAVLHLWTSGLKNHEKIHTVCSVMEFLGKSYRFLTQIDIIYTFAGMSD